MTRQMMKRKAEFMNSIKFNLCQTNQSCFGKLEKNYNRVDRVGEPLYYRSVQDKMMEYYFYL